MMDKTHRRTVLTRAQETIVNWTGARAVLIAILLPDGTADVQLAEHTPADASALEARLREGIIEVFAQAARGEES